MFSGLKHTFSSIEEHLKKLLSHVEARGSLIERTVDEKIETFLDEVRQEFIDLKAEVQSLRNQLANKISAPSIPAPVPAPTPTAIDVPIPEGTHVVDHRLVYNDEHPTDGPPQL